MDAITNALLLGSETALSLPAFDRIRAEHVAPAVERAMQLHRAEIAALAAQTEAPDFANTVAAFDRCGRLLSQVSAVFHALAASATSPALQAVQRELSAPLSAHHSAVYQHAALFQRIDAVHRQRATLGLSAEQLRLVERCHRDFVRSGAQLPAAERAEFAALQSQLAQLYTRFSQNLLHDENAYTLALPDEAAMAGLPEFVRAAARQAAADRGLATPVITLGRSLIVPFLSFSTRRDLREAEIGRASCRERV